jgi:hypothetical protein
MQYQKNRYMEGLTADELDSRFADCFTNQVLLTNEGKIGIGGIEWLEKFTHLLEEYGYRGTGVPPINSLGTRLRIPTPYAGQPLCELVRADYPSGIPETFTLFKYGEKRFLDPLLNEGTLRFRAASSYLDPSLNPAIHDDELTFEKIERFTRTRYRIRTDYYCFCSSWIHTDRLVDDFGADCVLVITDPHEFFRRLAMAVDDPRLEMRFNRVTYVDPLLLGEHELRDVTFIKHMRFTYQCEHRFIALPKRPVERLSELQLRLGPLNDIARLYST